MKVKIDTKVEPELAKRIRTDAQTEGRNFSAQIRWMLESWCKAVDARKAIENERDNDY